MNPYHALPIYTESTIEAYKNKRREENAPHIFAVADGAMQHMLRARENQSLLITGESGAGKTENTKRVIQYLAAIAVDAEATASRRAAGEPLGLLERQILQANPILEAFGNAQTVRNNNSSRFGKFIRIEFAASGVIAGGHIEWYLLEKSRVHTRSASERNFHVFYQLLRSGDAALLRRLSLTSYADDYAYLAGSRTSIEGVDDAVEWQHLLDALRTMGFSAAEEADLFRVVAVILHLGNVALAEDRSGQARIANPEQLALVASLVGVEVSQLNNALVRPTVRAGREVVAQARSKKQVMDEIAALCKTMYEKTFGWLVERINQVLSRPTSKSHFIGVLDIAGFEIFESNSFEQLCINYTNEKLQQFFNHHMFMLEQQEYAREAIDWDYVNFGLDLQPTIDLIESTSPIGILAALDEECIMPKATDLTFTDKLVANWGTAPKAPDARGAAHGSSKFLASRQPKRFVVRHYAANVEYTTEQWLDKNRDPLNDNVARVLAGANERFVSALFTEFVTDEAPRSGRRGAFRTVGARHKEQLASLMTQLDSTQPHFVRCIVPNIDKRPGRMDLPLVLEQLRCNGVLEGIRIARLGYPNRLLFADFCARYALLVPPGVVACSDGRVLSARIAASLGVDAAHHKIGLTKIFFKAGVLAALEEQRAAHLYELFARFQAACRAGAARRLAQKRRRRAAARETLRGAAHAYAALEAWPWWRLYLRLRPLLEATQYDEEAVRRELEMALARERTQRDERERRALAELEASLRGRHAELESALAEARAAGARADDRARGMAARLAEVEVAAETDRTRLATAHAELAALQQHIEASAESERELVAELEASAARLERELSERAALEREHGVAADRAAYLDEALADARRALAEHTEHAEAHVRDLGAQHETELQGVRAELERLQSRDKTRAAHAETAAAELREAHAERERMARALAAAEQRVAEHEAHRAGEPARLRVVEEAREAAQRAAAKAAAERDELHAALDAERKANEREAAAGKAEREELCAALRTAQAEQAAASEAAASAASELKVAHTRIHMLELDNKRLDSMQNKTIVEHVHVLEEAKRYTDRQLSDVQSELQELSTYTRTLERTRARMQQEQEALARTYSGLTAEDAVAQRDEARTALRRAERDAEQALRRTRHEYESKIQRLEDELRRVQKNKDTERALSNLGSRKSSHSAAARQVLAEIQMETELLAKDLARARSMQSPP